VAQGDNAAIEGIVADHSAVPALLDQAVTGDHGLLRFCEGDQELHHSRLQLTAVVIPDNRQFCWCDEKAAELELRLSCQIHLAHLPNCAERRPRIGNKS